MSEKEKKKASKKAKGEGEDNDGKSPKEAKDTKSKKDKDNTESNKKGGAKESDKKGAITKEADKKVGVATLPVDPNAPPPLDAEGNPICVQPDPKPTFAELWFDDPVEGEYAQKMAMELKGRIEVKALSIRQYLEGAIVDLLLQGLHQLVLARCIDINQYQNIFLSIWIDLSHDGSTFVNARKEPLSRFSYKGLNTWSLKGRPTNAAEYLAAFLLRNNPLKDVEFVEPPQIPSPTSTPPIVEAPKCCGCKVHCPATPTHHEDVPDFFRKGEKLGATGVPKKDEKLAPTEAPKKAT